MGYGGYGPCPPEYGVGPGPVRPGLGNTFALIIVLFILLIIIGATFVKY